MMVKPKEIVRLSPHGLFDSFLIQSLTAEKENAAVL